MNFWNNIKNLLSGKTSERDTAPRREEAEPKPDEETVPRSHADTAGRRTKPEASAPAKLMLYFSGWGYDERKGTGAKRDYGKRTELIEADGQTFEMRMIHECILFRVYGDTDERACLFLRHNSKRPWEYRYTQAHEFAQAIKQMQYGRCLLYTADVMTPQQCVYLYFDPDGSGFAQDENYTHLASFRWQKAFGQEWALLLAADPEQLRPLCKQLFDAQINPRSRNPYIDSANFENVPHRFLKGSEAELRLITTAIIHTEAGLFDTRLEPVTITYRAQTPTKRAGMTRLDQGKSPLINGRITSLCDLALRVNTFTGVEWKSRIPATTRLSDWEKHIHKVRVTVHPPSAHERAESLLVLADWLEGKVREAKRLRLLGIED